MRGEFFHLRNPGNGYKTTKSVNVDQLLNMQRYHRVAHQALRKDIESAVIDTPFDDIGVYARSYISIGTDDLHRAIIDNFTILVRYSDLVHERVTVDQLDFDAVVAEHKDETKPVVPCIEISVYGRQAKSTSSSCSSQQS